MTAWTDDTNLVCVLYILTTNMYNPALLYEWKPKALESLPFLKQHCVLYLADTITASPSCQPRPGSRFRHCLDKRKSPGKNTEPAAKMDNMIVGGWGQLTQRSQSTRTVLERLLSFPPFWKKRYYQINNWSISYFDYTTEMKYNRDRTFESTTMNHLIALFVQNKKNYVLIDSNNNVSIKHFQYCIRHMEPY